MKTDFVPSTDLKSILLYVVVYLLWFLNTLVCVAAVIQLQSTVNVFWVALGGDRYTLSLVNQVVILLGGFVAFVCVVSLEGYYRGSIVHRDKKPTKNDMITPQYQNRLAQWLTNSGVDVLLRRFAITTAIPIGVLVICLVALEVALRILQ